MSCKQGLVIKRAPKKKCNYESLYAPTVARINHAGDVWVSTRAGRLYDEDAHHLGVERAAGGTGVPRSAVLPENRANRANQFRGTPSRYPGGAQHQGVCLTCLLYTSDAADE